MGTGIILYIIVTIMVLTDFFNNLKWIRPNTDLSNVLQILAGDDINQVPVAVDHTVVGMIGRDNILPFIDILSGLGR